MFEPHTTFSVSQLRNAIACPRLFWFDLQQPGTRKTTWIRREGSGVGPAGTTFHRLAEQLHRTAPGDTSVLAMVARATSAPALGRQLANHLYERHARPLLDGYPGDLVELWDAIEACCELIGGLLLEARPLHADPGRAVEQVLVVAEQELSAILDGDGSEPTIELVGRCDAILHDLQGGRIMLVDYKLSSPASALEDRMQVVAYAMLLRELTGIQATPVVARFHHGLEIEDVAPEMVADLEDSLRAQLLEMWAWADFTPAGAGSSPPASPDLCTSCPYDRQCEEVLGSRRPLPVTPPSPPPPEPARWTLPTAEDEARAAMAKAVEALAGFGLRVDPGGFVVGPTFIRLELRPQMGVKVTSIRNRAEDLKVALQLGSLPYLEAGAGHVALDIERRERNPVLLSEALRYSRPVGEASFPLGIGVDGHIVEIDLADSNTCHLLVGGSTGSGKSELLRSLVCSLAARSTPEQLQLSIIDPKLVSFTDLDGSPYLRQEIVIDADTAAQVLEELVAEVEERFLLMREAGVTDLTALRRARPEAPLPRHVVLFDELADFMQDPEGKRMLEGSIKRLGAKARAAGLHLVLATQRPDRNVVTGLIRANLPCRIALSVASRINSQVILDTPGAEALLGKGDLLARFAGNMLRLQAPLAEPSLLRETLRLPA